MKEDVLIQAIGSIDDSLIEGAEKAAAKNAVKISWVKWGSVAAALALAAAIGAMILPGMFRADTPITLPIGENGEGIGNPNYTGEEIGMYEKYEYSVDAGKYSSYVQGKVISDSRVGGKLEDVTVTAGWVRAEGLPQAEKEHARAEIYEIEGVSADVAVAIRFIDELEAELTTCYYVIMNPDADLAPVRNYIITYDSYENNDGDE